MSEGKNFIGGIVLGAIAGAALALFLKSEKGQAFVEDAKAKADDLKNKFVDKAANTEAELQTLIAKGKAYVQELEQKLQQSQNI
jgi:gas vesicle protein